MRTRYALITALPCVAMLSCGADSAEPLSPSTSVVATTTVTTVTAGDADVYPTTTAETTTKSTSKTASSKVRAGDRLPVISEESVPFDQWPDACDFITDEQVKALTPGARTVSHNGTLGTLTDGGNTDNNIECTYHLDGDNKRLFPARVEVEIEHIGVDPIKKEVFDSTMARWIADGGYFDVSAEMGGPAFAAVGTVFIYKSGYKLWLRGVGEGVNGKRGPTRAAVEASPITAIAVSVSSRIAQ